MKIKIHKYSIIIVLLLIISVGFNIANAVTDGAEPGSEQDPLITKSYVDEITKISAAEIASLKKQLEDLKNQMQSGGSQGFAVLVLEAGQTLLPGAGTELILRSGKAIGIQGEYGKLADVTSAKDLSKGAAAVINHLLISSRDDGRGLKAVTKAYFLIRGAYKTSGQQQADSSIEQPANDSGNSQTESNSTPEENQLKKGKVNASALNVRKEPNTTAAILAKVYQGETVSVMSGQGDWLNIKTSAGVTGWVLAQYIIIQ